MTVTIRDVAVRAHVSLSTVSHVINKTRVVLPETTARVEAAIAELGFQPNTIARSLKSNRTMTIGMLVANTRNPFFASVLHGVEDECFIHGYNLILCNTEDEETRQAAYLKSLRQKRVDAMIIMTTNRYGPAFNLLQNFHAVPTVALFTGAKGVDCVIVDDSFTGGQLAARRLIAGGASRLACISGQNGHPLSDARLRGFRDELQKAGLKLAATHIVEGGWSLSGGKQAMQKLLSARGRTADGVFAMNDMMAIGALSAVTEHGGLSVPEDVALIGYDDIEFSAYTYPPLTTISQKGDETGRLAVTRILDLIDGRTVPGKEELVAPVIVERQSVREPLAAMAKKVGVVG